MRLRVNPRVPQYLVAASLSATITHTHTHTENSPNPIPHARNRSLVQQPRLHREFPAAQLGGHPRQLDGCQHRVRAVRTERRDAAEVVAVAVVDEPDAGEPARVRECELVGGAGEAQTEFEVARRPVVVGLGLLVVGAVVRAGVVADVDPACHACGGRTVSRLERGGGGGGVPKCINGCGGLSITSLYICSPLVSQPGLDSTQQREREVKVPKVLPPLLRGQHRFPFQRLRECVARRVFEDDCVFERGDFRYRPPDQMRPQTIHDACDFADLRHGGFSLVGFAG